MLTGNAWELAGQLSAESVNCIVTSPPYWGLRDYGVDGQFGLEKTPDEYIAKLVELFSILRPKLRKDGTLFVNLGDSYIANPGDRNKVGGIEGMATQEKKDAGACMSINKHNKGLKPKDLCLIPFRFALAMQAAGWWVRNVIIWAKPNPMPESVTDRCTTSHEYIFFFTRSAKYWCDMDAVREELLPQSIERNQYAWNSQQRCQSPDEKRGEDNRPAGELMNPAGRNLRSVWTFPTQPYPEAHFATFPEKLPGTCILMGCPEKACAVCGKPYERQIEQGELIAMNKRGLTGGGTKDDRKKHDEYNLDKAESWQGKPGKCYERTDLGIFPTCSCNSTTDSGVVLDPFAGSGTTLAVAKRLRRHYLGFELSPEYVQLCEKRLQLTQQPMF